MDTIQLVALMLTFIVLISAIFLTQYLHKIGKVLASITVLTLLVMSLFVSLFTDVNIAVKTVYGLMSLVAIVYGLRIYAHHYSQDYLMSQSRRTYLELVFASIIVVGSSTLMTEYLSLDVYILGIVYGWLSFMIAIIMLLRVVGATHMKPRVYNEKPSTEKPTVSIAIPARNEDAVLEKSLHQHLTSTYPKLEYLVLDDCSQDKTPQIIKSFAHQGIRFISGRDTKGEWLGKNHAYQQLLEQASGEYILFCGVDIELSQGAITELLATLRRNNLDMLAVLPEYEPPIERGKIIDVTQQITRYYWQLAVTGILKNSPATIGSCWLVRKQALVDAGGFKSVKRMTEPERFFAKRFNDEKKYAFVTSKQLLSKVMSTKRPVEQYWHTLRVAYPLLRQNVSYTFLTILGIALFFFVPISLIPITLTGLVTTGPIMLLGLSGGLILVSYFLVFYASARPYSWWSPILLPFSLLQIMVLIAWSMLRYEFDEVSWKGRNVCIPVLDLKFKPAPKRKKPYYRHRRKRRRRF